MVAFFYIKMSVYLSNYTAGENTMNTKSEEYVAIHNFDLT